MIGRRAEGRRAPSDTRRWRVAGGVLLVSIIVLYGFPIYWMVATSLKSAQEVGTLTWIPSEISLDPYRAFFRSDFLPALRNSAIIAGITGALTMALAIPASYGLARSRSRLVTPALLLLLVVQMIPTSATFIPLFQMLATLGLVDTYLGVSLAQATLFVPFAVLLLRPAFAAIPPSVEEAATLDGAGSVRYLIGIALPLLRNTVIVTTAIVLVSSWAELVYPLTLLLDDDKYPLSVLIAQSIGRFESNYNNLMAIAVLSSLPVLLVVLAAQGQLRRGLTLGAVK